MHGKMKLWNDYSSQISVACN